MVRVRRRPLRPNFGFLIGTVAAPGWSLPVSSRRFVESNREPTADYPEPVMSLTNNASPRNFRESAPKLLSREDCYTTPCPGVPSHDARLRQLNNSDPGFNCPVE